MSETAIPPLPAGHPLRFPLLVNRALWLRRRFHTTADPADIDASIAAGRAALQEQPEGAVARSGLAIALATRHRLSGAPRDLAEAIDHGTAAAELFAPDHPERGVALAHLSSMPLTRARATGSATDLEEALRRGRAATTSPGEHHRVHARSALTDALTAKSRRSGELPDLLALEESLRQRLADGESEEFRARLVL